ncbi:MULTISPECIES: DUF6343 family protein [unclassified Streptomyces]|uniref:DUF6343 family protein n=1 Tax=unclassified Streptomyces TaxID=2593676 RepID=UPI0028775B6D|nr:DUF6343 family protein [Streptomyces sp. BB1-1-1]WND33537.1 DUF6343 family protein [Streptomyces sp. BB1-1-1]
MSDRRRPDGATEPASRARSGAIGRRFPRTGTEPVTAQSPLRLRLLLSAVFLPLFVAGAAFFGVWAADTGPGDSPGRGSLVALAAVCAAFVLLAAADLMVVAGRLRRERGAPAPH